MNNPRNWSDDEIRDYFDSNPNLRMQHLARMVGKSMHELKRILMPGRNASAERVAGRYKAAYKLDKGSGGLLFRFDRDGLFVRTEAKDPHGQVYSASITMSGSGKIALRNLTKMWNDPKIRREIMSLRKKYDVMEYIDNALKEMGTRGRLRWHSWHSPD
jgi:hypothetical protein